MYDGDRTIRYCKGGMGNCIFGLEGGLGLAISALAISKYPGWLSKVKAGVPVNVFSMDAVVGDPGGVGADRGNVKRSVSL